ncbi:MFS transporter [Rhizobium sp. Root1203]|uniref:MFS transporter n=1 Tax=Rhizobium sp. Root1203 TaxID=1736427 RepID=UPI001FCD55EE|nr:MFS transporter [Rhizobium sp. Root1203]
MFTPSIPKIADELHADFALISLTIAGFSAVSAIAGLVMGALSDRFGRRPIILVSLGIFAAASAGCSLTTNIWPFLICRLVQGIIIVSYRVPLALLRDTSDERTTASKIGYISTAWAIAPLIAPTIGGAMDELFGWRSIFTLFTALGVIGLMATYFFIPETNARRSTSIAVQIRNYRDLVQSGRFWAYALCLSFSLGTFYGFLAGAPLVAEKLLGGSTVTLGLYMGVTPAGFILGSYLAGRCGPRFAPNSILIFARSLTSVSLFAGLALYLCGVIHPVAFFGPCVFIGVGNGLTMPAANAVILSIRPDLAGSASGLAGALASAGGAIVAFSAGLLITNDNASIAVFGVMIASSALALFFALAATVLDRRKGLLIQ